MAISHDRSSMMNHDVNSRNWSDLEPYPLSFSMSNFQNPILKFQLIVCNIQIHHPQSIVFCTHNILHSPLFNGQTISLHLPNSGVWILKWVFSILQWYNSRNQTLNIESLCGKKIIENLDESQIRFNLKFSLNHKFLNSKFSYCILKLGETFLQMKGKMVKVFVREEKGLVNGLDEREKGSDDQMVEKKK